MPRKEPDPTPLPSYRNPPVQEVVCGARFAALERFMVPHIGLFWDSVRKDFPNCEHAAPLSLDPSVLDAATGLPIPRIWLINRSEDRLIQLQRDVFFYNWRQRSKNKRYPRYKNIIKSFDKYIRNFERFVKENELGELSIKSFELTYINHIIQGEGWKSLRDIGTVFPDCRWKAKSSRFLPVPSGISWRASFPLPEGQGTLSAKVDRGMRRSDEHPLLAFELKATGSGANNSLDNMEEWFSTAHEWIVRSFADLTGVKIQTEIWKRDDSFAG
ncbi:MAG: TIGR04255 family protein [Anaerolineales bacterium]